MKNVPTFTHTYTYITAENMVKYHFSQEIKNATTVFTIAHFDYGETVTAAQLQLQ